MLRILVITSCTGEKAIHHPRALTLEDFQQGAAHVALREQELVDLLTPAENLYSGLQHVRLMRGIRAYREYSGKTSLAALDLYILSAGYGLIPANKKLAPYECTFQGMKKGQLRAWADALNVPAEIRRVLAEPYDLALVLLGDAYLEACALDGTVQLGGPTLLFCGANTAASLPHLDNLHTVVVTNQDAKRFSCGLVGLKGEVASRALNRIASDPGVLSRFIDPTSDILTMLHNEDTGPQAGAFVTRPGPRVNMAVDKVISIPSAWWDKPHRAKLRYFIPEWDDLVDPDYDFENDTHSGGSGDWSNEVYAHQLYPEPNYDGILISKVVAEKSKAKKERINALGVHRYLRVPPDFPIIGDCGAFGYIAQDVPPYTTEEILDYYTRLGFNYGVSVDHLIVTATEAQKKFRYELTIHNAEEFLREHKRRGLPWEPIGAVQGWDPQSYAEAARQYVAMGYRYIALGGLVRTSTEQILGILEDVRQSVPDNVKIHVFGVARLSALSDFARLGVASVDSAAFLRRAWMGTDKNYFTPAGEVFSAIRIPGAGKSFRAKRMVDEGRATLGQVEALEAASLKAIYDFDAGLLSVESTLDILCEYDRLIEADRPEIRSLMRRTLEAAPWKSCPCEICKRDGVQVILFRGNNRNRRRGFHNTYIFYQLLQRVLAGEAIAVAPSSTRGLSNPIEQLSLPLLVPEEA